MKESRIEATDRLRKEGQWSEASLFCDEERRRLRSEGMTKAEANDQAWEAMVAKFPPLASRDTADEGHDETDWVPSCF